MSADSPSRSREALWRCAAVVALALIALAAWPAAQTRTLLDRIREIAADARGQVAVACGLPDARLDCNLDPHARPPMQSVFKLPLAVTVLHEVEQGTLALDQTVRFGPDDRILPRAYSPLQDKYPGGDVDVRLDELLRLAVALSDNVAADMLLRVVGGPQAVGDYVAALGVTGFHLEDNEHAMHRDVQAQYRNWFEPAGAVALLRRLAERPPLSPRHTALLMQWMQSSVKAARLGGDLPAGTVIAHKAGTSAVDNGLAHATNDIGLISLPDGRHLAIAVFITDARADEATRERTIPGSPASSSTPPRPDDCERTLGPLMAGLKACATYFVLSERVAKLAWGAG